MRIKLFFAGCLILFFQFGIEKAFAQLDFTVNQYTSVNGLPQNSVKSLAFDSLGCLWMTTEGGLVRFDGRNFKTFNKANSDQLISDRLLNIYKTSKGQLIFTDTYGGCYLIEHNGIKTLKVGSINAYKFMAVKGILPSPEFYIHYISINNKFTPEPEWTCSPVKIFSESDKTYYVVTKKGLAYYDQYKFVKELDLERLKPTKFFYLQNRIYFITSNNSCFWVDTQKWQITTCKIEGADFLEQLSRVTEINDVFYDNTPASTFTRIGNFLYQFSTPESPNVISSKLITRNLPLNCKITSIVNSPENNFLAVGTDTKGLFVFKQRHFKTLEYDMPEEGTNNAYYFQLTVDSNTVYTDWDREFSSQGGKKSNLKINCNIYETIFRDSKGYLWYSRLDTLLRYDPSSKTTKKIYYNYGDRVLSFCEEGDSIWAGSKTGIGIIKNDKLEYVYHADWTRGSLNPLQILRGPDHKLWICNANGIYRYSTSNKSLDTLPQLFQQTVRCVLPHNGFLEIGTYGGGFYLYKNERLVKLPLDKNKYLSYVHAFVNDANGNMWITTNKGLFKTVFSELENYFNDTTRQVYYYNYGSENGINNPEFNGGVYPSVLKLDNGYFSLPSMDGLVWFKPESVKDVVSNTPIIVENIFLDDSIVSSVPIGKIPSNTKTIKVEFSTSYWGNEQNLTVEYNLEGYSKQWIPLASSQNNVVFSNLPSGKYTLHIRKKDGLKSGKFIVASVLLNVEEKFYETLLFRFLCLILLLILIIVIARLYARNIARKNKSLEENVRLRTIELSIANRDLQQSVSVKDKLISIISHDILTPLRFISVVARKGADPSNALEKEKLKMVLTDIKNTSEKLHNNTTNILNWIKHQNKKISLHETNVAVSALADEVAEIFEDVAESNNTHIRNTISYDDIIITDQIILSIILHNLVSNATKFTFNGTIEITGGPVENGYSISVSDTGTGMNTTQFDRIQQILQKKQDSPIDPVHGENGFGLGYIIISELIALLNGKITVDSENGKGTTISIVLPINS